MVSISCKLGPPFLSPPLHPSPNPTGSPAPTSLFLRTPSFAPSAQASRPFLRSARSQSRSHHRVESPRFPPPQTNPPSPPQANLLRPQSFTNPLPTPLSPQINIPTPDQPPPPIAPQSSKAWRPFLLRGRSPEGLATMLLLSLRRCGS